MNDQKLFNRYVVVAGALILGLLGGLVYSWSLFVKPVCSAYGWQTSQVAMMGSAMVAFFCAGCSLGGNMLPRLGARTTAVTGSVMFGAGVLVSSFVRVPWLMYITWGLCGGLGIGMLYAIGMFVASAWFPEKRGFIVGLFLSVFGLSLTVFSKPISVMLNSLGVSTTMLVLGIAFLVILTPVSLFTIQAPPPGYGGKTEKTAEKTTTGAVSCTVSESLHTRSFAMFAAGIFLLVIPYSYISSFTSVFATDFRGLTADQAVTIVSSMGIGACLGRLSSGFLTDRIGCRLTMTIYITCNFISLFLILFATSYTGILIGFFFCAAAYGGHTPIYGVWPVQQYGPDNASAVYGFAALGPCFSTILGPMVTNAVGYMPATVICLFVTLTGYLCFLLTPRLNPYMKKNGQTKAS